MNQYIIYLLFELSHFTEPNWLTKMNQIFPASAFLYYLSSHNVTDVALSRYSN